MLTTYETDRKLNHDIMERKEQKARKVTLINEPFSYDPNSSKPVKQQAQEYWDSVKVQNKERYRMNTIASESWAKFRFLVKLLGWGVFAIVLIALLYGLWSHDITFEQVFANGGQP